MKKSIGNESTKFVRDARKATRACLAISGGGEVLFADASVVIRITTFWFGQMRSQTFRNMMIPSPPPIAIGGGLGIIMFLNVWLLIWPNQKVVIRMTTEAAASKTSPSPEMAKHARIAFLASRTNFYLSFPMLFFMATASHYQLF